MNRFVGQLVFWGSLATPVSSFAHSPIEGIDNFYNGLLHPLFVPAHLTLLIALGVYIGQRGAKANQPALGAFFIGTISGLVIAWFNLGYELELVILISSAIIGVLIAANLGVGPSGCAVIALLVGLFVGMDSRQGLLTGRDKLVTLLGTGAGVLLLTLYPMAMLENLKEKGWAKIGARIVGSWITASALLVLVLSFATLPAR